MVCLHQPGPGRRGRARLRAGSSFRRLAPAHASRDRRDRGRICRPAPCRPVDSAGSDAATNTTGPRFAAPSGSWVLGSGTGVPVPTTPPASTGHCSSSCSPSCWWPQRLHWHRAGAPPGPARSKLADLLGTEAPGRLGALWRLPPQNGLIGPRREVGASDHPRIGPVSGVGGGDQLHLERVQVITGHSQYLLPGVNRNAPPPANIPYVFLTAVRLAYRRDVIGAVILAAAIVLAVGAGLAWTAHRVHVGSLDALALAKGRRARSRFRA